MKKQRILAVLLAGLMASALFAGCNKTDEPQGDNNVVAPDYLNETGLPITKEKTTVTAMGKKDPGAPDWNDLELFQYLEEQTNIHFDFELAESDTYTEKKNLKLVSGQYPEVFFRGMEISDEESYGPQGVFRDLTDLVKGYAPNLTKRMEEYPALKAASTALDGKMYSLPYNQETAFLNPHLSFVGQNWLDNCGITELPKTVDDFYDMLVKFKTMDANGNGDATDEVPISGLKWDQIEWFLEPAFTGTVTGKDFDITKDGKLVYAPATEGYKEYCRFLNKLWTENLIDHELLTQTQQQFQAKVKNGTVGVYNSSPTLFDDATITDANGDLINQVSLIPLTSEWNDTPTVRQMETIYTGKLVITDKCKVPEAVIRWADMFYATPDENETINGNTFFLGLKGEHWDYTDETKTSFQFIDPITSFTDINNAVSVNMEMPCYLKFEAYQAGNPKMEMKVKGVQENQNPYRKAGYPANARYTTEESDAAQLIEADLKNYVESMTAKFMTGEESIDNFDTFVSSLNNMGLEKLIKIKQDVYDRWMAASK